MNIEPTNLPSLNDGPGLSMEYTPRSKGLERILADIGLRHPSTRFAVYGTATAVGLFFLEPEFAFYNRKARPWSLLTGPDDESEVPPTKVPWYVLAGSAALFGLAF